MQNSSSPQLDLTGKLIIKVALGDDIRRIPIHNEDITYDELVLMMQRVYRGKLSTNDDITIKYKDEDGDLITIFDSSDLTFAIQCSRILKITLFVNDGPKSLLDPAVASSVRQELQDIRDRVVSLLDRLSNSNSLVAGAQALSLTDGITGKGDGTVSSSIPVSGTSSRAVNAVGGKEFDPLTSQKSVDEATQNKIMNSFGMDGNIAPVSSSQQQYDRAATPDSVSSIGSSASNQVRPQQGQPMPPTSSAIPTPQQQQQQQVATPQQPPQSLAQQQPQQPPQQMAYAGQPGYAPGPPSQMGQSYAGQPGFGPPQQQAGPQATQQPPQQTQQQQQYDPAMYGQQQQQQQQPPQQFGPGYPGPGQPNAPPASSQAPAMYGQPGAPYAQAPGMPQAQAKGPGYPPAPGMGGQSPGNPYSRGTPSYGAGYPRPSAGYPQ